MRGKLLFGRTVTLANSGSDDFQSLNRDILADVPRFRADERYRELRTRVDLFALDDPDREGDYLRILLDVEFGRTPMPEALARLEGIVMDTATSGDVRAHALVLRASLGMGIEAPEQNARWRAMAFAEARERGAVVTALIVLTNWVAAECQWGRYDVAAARLQDLDEHLPHVPQDELVRPWNRQAVSRSLTHKAKVDLRRDDGRSLPDRVNSAVQSYRNAIEREAEDDERRFNFMVEMAEEFADFGVGNGLHQPIATAHEVLERAKRSFDTHSCWRCRGYFSLVTAKLLRGTARTRISLEAERRTQLLAEASESANEAIREFEPMNHPLGPVANDLASRLDDEIREANRPRRIFLSHAGANKPLVRQFYEALRVAAFEPWIDEEDMVAGDRLHRTIQEGLSNSCAAVFFITSDFQDERFLMQEIDWALAEKTKREEFAIVTIVMPGATAGRVPEVLRSFVWKEPQSELEALREIVRALPLKPGTPHF